MTSEWPARRAGSRVRASTSTMSVLTRMRFSNACQAGIGSASSGAVALHGVAVRVASVAVGAAELAPDVRIDGPEAHAGAGGRVERRADGEREEAGAAPALVEERPAGWRLDAGAGAEQIELGGLLRGGAHPQRPHPHCWQQRQPEARTTGPAHSGQRRMSSRVAGLGWRWARWR